MNKRQICVVAVIGAGLLGGSSLAQADATDTLLASVGEFQLDNGETKTVLRGAEIKGYRVCMDEAPDAVPLKVTYDGKVAIVEPGDCQLIMATKIKLASAAALHDGMTLIGSFNGDSRKKYNTSVSLAQVASR
jgi:hypothetical protein